MTKVVTRHLVTVNQAVINIRSLIKLNYLTNEN
jgi:hypothetical protein